MKTSIATTLSVVGVIAAGAAAYAVNTSVLGAAAENPPTAVAQAPTSSVAASSIGNVSNAAVVSQQSEASDSTTTYKVGDAGSVVIDTSTGQIVVTSILPAAGFTSEPARADANGVVKVHFVSSTQRIEFIAKLVNGAVVTDVVNETPTSMAPPREHHDDDDEYEDDEHEERHREDHDEDEDDD
jgi:hypothetical protein